MMLAHRLRTSDKNIRLALIKKLKNNYTNSNAAIIPEFTLPYGSARVDVAVISSMMHGYELKSDIDNLFRLNGQMDSYNLIFDKVTLVVGRNHVVKAINIIPDWWGIIIAKISNEKSNPLLIPVRPACDNPNQDVITIANMLWKDEALAILDRLGKSQNLRSKPKKIICEKLVESINPQTLKDFVREFLIKRVRSQAV